MKICGIYKITSPSNKIYIGQSIDIVKRWNVYHRLHCANQTRLYYSFKKHGTEKHKFEILCQCDKSELNNLEEYYIRLYQTFNSKFGMNLQCRNDERIEISEETREKMSINRVGRKGYWKGKKLSEATRKKMSLAHLNKKLSQETKDKISKIHKGRKHSEEFKRKISIALKNRTVSEKTREKMRIKMIGNKYALKKNKP